VLVGFDKAAIQLLLSGLGFRAEHTSPFVTAGSFAAVSSSPGL